MTARIALCMWMALGVVFTVPAARGDPPCVNWSNLPNISSRRGHAMAYDSARGV